jgi:hypothetical protein
MMPLIPDAAGRSEQSISKCVCAEAQQSALGYSVAVMMARWGRCVVRRRLVMCCGRYHLRLRCRCSTCRWQRHGYDSARSCIGWYPDLCCFGDTLVCLVLLFVLVQKKDFHLRYQKTSRAWNGDQRHGLLGIGRSGALPWMAQQKLDSEQRGDKEVLTMICWLYMYGIETELTCTIFPCCG